MSDVQVKVFCVDLDGTLIRSDLLYESLLIIAKKNVFDLLKVLFAIFKGKAAFKRSVAEAVKINPATLPYNSQLIELLKIRKDSGAKLVLATACDEILAKIVADYLGIFDEVLASDGKINLKRKQKLALIQAKYSEFAYAGNSNDDIVLMDAAAEAILVEPSSGLLKATKNHANRFIIANKDSSLFLILRAMRVQQWVKNLLLFVPIVMAHKFSQNFSSALPAFIAFCFSASAVYLINDLFDLESDRRHPFKRFRPLAAGRLSIQTAVLLAVLLFLAGILIALSLNSAFFAVLMAYIATTFIYSFHIKQVALIDIITLASLYTLRIFAGSAVTGTHLSPWLLVFSMFMFLALAALKRYSEVIRIKSDGGNEVHGRGYKTTDATIISQLGTSSSYLSVLVLGLYIMSAEVKVIYHNISFLWLLCPIILYWLSRLWLLAHRKHLIEDPIVFALRDKASLISGILCLLVLLMAH